MKKWILYLLCLMPISGMAETTSSMQSELNQLNSEIQSLKNQLKKIRFEEMKEDVDGQGLMIADWDAYAQDVEQLHSLGQNERQIVQQIKRLEERKASLLQQQSQQPSQFFHT